jgi:mannitol/fructose-specific phosphotransferase system IIA component
MSDVLTLSQIKMPGTARSKDDAIRETGEILVDVDAVTPAYIDSMFERERSVSTYMGNYLAIPHGTNESKESIKRSALSVVRYPEPIDWDGTVASASTVSEQRDCRYENSPPSPCSCSATVLRRLPLPARRDRAGGPLVPALRPVIPRR